MGYSHCKGLKSIVIPDCVKEIDILSFDLCISLENIKLPAGLETINKSAFSSCYSLKNIVIPDGTKRLCSGAFGYSYVETITIPASVISIDNIFNQSNTEPVVIAPEGSYAYNWAVSNGISVITSETEQQAQTIVCSSSFNKKLGCEPFKLGATAKTDMTYTSDSSDIASVSADGTVTVKGVGTAKITITAEETLKYKSASKEVTITVIKPLEQEIKAADSFTKLITDSQFNLNASAIGKLSYSSSNSNIVSVSQTGLVTIKNVGTATITVTAAETGDYKSASKQITITVNKAEQTIKGADRFIKQLEDGSFSLGASAEGKLTYKTNNTDVVSVSKSGIVTSKGYGSAIITIEAAETDKYNKAVKKVNIFINKPEQIITGDDSFTKEYGCEPFGLGASAAGKLSYESSNNNVASVSSAGIVTVKNSGVAIITVTAAETDNYAKTTKSVLINVKKDDQDILGDISFYKTYGCEPFDLGVIAEGECTFTSSNTKVASVSDKGIVTITGAGVAVITIEADSTNNYNERTKTVTITVSKASQTIECKDKITKTFNFKTFKIGAEASTNCTYKCSNTKLAEVNELGDVTLKNPGKVTITITAAETANYTGDIKTVTITSKLAKPVVKAKKTGKNKIKLSWERVTGASGYKIYVYDSAKKKYICRLTKKASVKSVTHKGLKTGKTYKYKIRAYRVVNGKKVYSPYSKVKTVKVG